MKKNTWKIFVIFSLIVLMSTNAFAMEETKNMECFNDNEIIETIVDGPNVLNEDYNNTNKLMEGITDQELLENYDLFNTKGNSRRLWSSSYSNTYNVKKRIIASNYSYPLDNGIVYVNIRNTGSSRITINIYQGTRESKTITAGTVAPNQTRQFAVGRQYGSTVCSQYICHAEQNFTISAYNVDSKISFTGTADIKY